MQPCMHAHAQEASVCGARGQPAEMSTVSALPGTLAFATDHLPLRHAQCPDATTIMGPTIFQIPSLHHARFHIQIQTYVRVQVRVLQLRDVSQ